MYRLSKAQANTFGQLLSPVMHTAIASAMYVSSFASEQFTLMYKLASLHVSHAVVEFRFEQPTYSIAENGTSQAVCVLLVMGSLDQEVALTVQSSNSGTAIRTYARKQLGFNTTACVHSQKNTLH